MRKGGAFLASGANTCVYDPPLECLDGTTIDDPSKYVSRVVYGNEDLEAQKMVKGFVDEVEAEYPGKIRNRFNFFEKSCSNFEVKESDVSSNKGKKCSIDDFNISKPEKITHLTNIITPKQEEDVFSKGQISRPKNVVVPELYELMRVLARIEGRFVHMDLHFGNIAWKGDKLVIHDFGIAEPREKFKERFRDFIKNRTNDKFKYALNYVQWKTGVVIGYSAATIIGVNQAVEDLSRVFDILSIITGMHQYKLITDDVFDNITDNILNMLINDFTTEQLIKEINRSEKEVLGNAPDDYNPGTISPPRAFDTAKNYEESPEVPQGKQNTTAEIDEIIKKAIKVSGGAKGTRPANKLCRCIKHVRETGKDESSAIAICVRSVIPAGRTLKKFTCKRKAKLSTQKRLTRRRK